MRGVVIPQKIIGKVNENDRKFLQNSSNDE